MTPQVISSQAGGGYCWGATMTLELAHGGVSVTAVAPSAEVGAPAPAV